MARSHKRIITKEWRKNISTGKINGANKWAKGRSLKPNGYIEITRGENKGRGEHVVVMESIIGRRLYANECVHHKDFVRSNNKPTNLELMTRSEHLKLHRKLDNHRRIRDKKGRFL
ncbi:MAG: hypothetical protein GY714_18290 [Desulfobacterales bacterium]|nr:hypothetical protein [Desulfobacterales bacterium]